MLAQTGRLTISGERAKVTLKFVGKSRLDCDSLPGGRGCEDELVRMQKESMERTSAGRTIERIAHNWVADARKVHPDLMSPPGSDAHAQK